MKTVKMISIMVISLGMILVANSALFAEGIPLSQLIFYADFESDTPGSPPDTGLYYSYPPDDYIILGYSTAEGNSALVKNEGGNNILEIVQTHPGFPGDAQLNLPPIPDKAFFYGGITGVTKSSPLPGGQYALLWSSSLQPGSPAGTTGAGFGNSHGGYAFAVIYGDNGTILVQNYDGNYDTGVPYQVGVRQSFYAELNATAGANFTLFINGVPVTDESGSPKLFTFVDPQYALVKFAVTIGHNAAYGLDYILLIRHPLVEPEFVDIDVKPGSGKSCIRINFRAKGTVPVAIYGSDMLDVRTIDLETVRLSGASIKIKPKRAKRKHHRKAGKSKYQCRWKDIDEDGFVDLICKFRTDQLVILDTGKLFAVLEAQTNDGTSILGEERICVIKNDKPDRSKFKHKNHKFRGKKHKKR